MSVSGELNLHTNILANFFGGFLRIFLSIIFVPIYIHYLGIESYGLIGFYAMLQGSISVLELGLSRACTREFAINSQSGHTDYKKMQDVLRSLEIVYWLVALSLGIILAFFSPIISRYWINSSQYKPEELIGILKILSWSVAIRWPIGVYTSALLGLQQHLKVNILQTLQSTFTGLGSILILQYWKADIFTFFYWQLIFGLISVVTFAYLAWKNLPCSVLRARFYMPVLKKIWSFSRGIRLNAVLGTIQSQSDKIILSAILPLKIFGYYVLASTIAQALIMIASAFSTSVFPRFSQMTKTGHINSDVFVLYRLVSQYVGCIIIPLGLTIAFFPQELLYSYTGNTDLSKHASSLLTVLIIATIFHASGAVPYAFQMASGSTHLSVYMNAINLVWRIPSTIYFSYHYGSIGAAYIYLLGSSIHFLLVTFLIYRNLTMNGWWHWLLNAMIWPLALTLPFLFIAKEFLNVFSKNRIMIAIELMAISLFLISATIFRLRLKT